MPSKLNTRLVTCGTRKFFALKRLKMSIEGSTWSCPNQNTREMRRSKVESALSLRPGCAARPSRRVGNSIAFSGDAAGLRRLAVGAGLRERLRLGRAVAVSRVEVDLERHLPHEPPLEPVPLVAVGVAVLLRELGRRVVRILEDPGVAQREGVALVVVVGLVLGVRVEELQTDAVGVALVDAEGESPVPALGGGLDGRHPADAVGPVLAQAGRPGAERLPPRVPVAELRGVAVDEPRQVLRVGPVVFEEKGQIRDHFAFGGDAPGGRVRVLEVLVDDENARANGNGGDLVSAG